MSRSYIEFCAASIVQISCWTILAAGNSILESRDYLDPRETVSINFPPRRNSTFTRYLPPDIDYLLPEVIDNRARNVTDGTKIGPTNVLRVPSLDMTLQAPLSNEARDSRNYRRPSYLQTKQSTRLPLPQMDSAGILTEPKTIKIIEMSCQDSTDERHFRVLFSVLPTSSELPIVDSVNNDFCKITRVNHEYSIDIRTDRFASCGVTDCSMNAEKSYCLGVRFPTISGLRLRDDAKITLRCKVQDRIVSHTKQINVKTLDATGRGLPSVITGGFKNSLDTEVGLFRKTYASENIFDARIQSGETVVLGEEILLRVLVKEGDGWRYSRISDVTFHFVERRQRKKTMNSLTILGNDGCLKPNVREICSREQYRMSALETYLIFQAFMFENMKETDEMILSVKIMGCLDGADCALNCPAGHNRRSRSVRNESIADWQDDIAFRVLLRKSEINSLYDVHYALPLALFGCAALVILALIWTIKVLLRRKI